MRSTHVVAIVVLALSLAGCQGLPSPTGSSPHAGASPSASPSASPIQERETGLTQPRQVFDGDCGALFTEDELGAALGATVSLAAPDDLFDNEGIINQQNGGLRCGWYSDPYAAFVDVLVVPAAAVDYDEPTGCGAYLESGVPACPLEAVAGGIRISGLVASSTGDISAIESATESLRLLFEQRATPENAAPVPLPAVGSWAYPVNCEAIVAASDFSAVPGLGSASLGYTGAGGSDAYYPRAVSALWGASGLPHCGIEGESVSLDFDAFGGGRWKEAELSASPATKLPVDGVDAVYATALGDGSSRINVFDGPNWLQFTVKFTKNAGPIATQLVTALDATAIE